MYDHGESSREEKAFLFMTLIYNNFKGLPFGHPRRLCLNSRNPNDDVLVCSATVVERCLLRSLANPRPRSHRRCCTNSVFLSLRTNLTGESSAHRPYPSPSRSSRRSCCRARMTRPPASGARLGPERAWVTWVSGGEWMRCAAVRPPQTAVAARNRAAVPATLHTRRSHPYSAWDAIGRTNVAWARSSSRCFAWRPARHLERLVQHCYCCCSGSVPAVRPRLR